MGILMKTTEVDLGTTSYRSCAVAPEFLGAMEAPNGGSDYFSDTLHTIAIKTRETEFGGIIQPIPITLKTYTQLQFQDSISGYQLQQQVKNVFNTTRLCEDGPSTSGCKSPIKDEEGIGQKITRPPKKKWIKEYLEEEPRSPVSVRVVTGLPVTPRSNGVVRSTSPVLPAAPPAPPASTLASVTIEPVSSLAAPPPAPLDFVQEHSRLRTTSTSHGLSQVPSPPSVGSNGSGSGSSGSGSAPRAGTREVHNKLEKNRRAHLKECFELLKRQLPATSDDKKISNLSILGSAIRYIQVLRRKERDCEHEMEKLAREKIAAQQRLAALRREVSIRTTARQLEAGTEDKEREDRINGQVLGIPISITSSPPHSVTRVEPSSTPQQTLNLSTKLRTLPIQITPTTSQVVRTYGARHNTLTLTTLAPADTSTQNGQTLENGVTSTIGTTLVHPAQIHLPLSQVVGSGGLVVGPAALQLVSTGGGLRVLHTNGQLCITTGENNRIARENGIVTSTTTGHSEGGVVVSGLAPIVVSQPAAAAAHLLQTHTLTHKMVETQMVKGTQMSSVTPLTVSAQYLSATTIVKPVVVVSGAHTPPAPPT